MSRNSNTDFRRKWKKKKYPIIDKIKWHFTSKWSDHYEIDYKERK